MRNDPSERTRALVEAMRLPRCYFHAAAAIEVVETHISYVVLAGPFAYKIKKPIQLPFLDYSTLEARRRHCEEEVRLNGRTAPELYLGVVPICGNERHPVVGGTGPALEYAVRMRRFPQEAQLDRLAMAGTLQPRVVDALAQEIARLHETAGRAPPSPAYGSPDAILGNALDNFRTIDSLEATEGRPSILGEIEAWTIARHGALREALLERQRGGAVRECHGDLHLGNVVLLEHGPVPFDCIEFDPALRWIDVMSDVAFTVMDLHYQGYPDFAARLLNAYLERTGDYAGLRVLRFYLVYLAMVRAKIACIRSHQRGRGEREARHSREAFHAYLRLAGRLTSAQGRGLVLMHGLSGSGKTTVAATLVEQLGAISVRSDIVRKAIHGFEPLARSHSGIGTGLYDPIATERTYLEMAHRALAILRSGYPALIDAAFLDRRQRRRFRDIAASEGVPFAIVDCVAPKPVLRARLALRHRLRTDASEADGSVLEAQIAAEESFDAAERQSCFTCDTTREHSGDLVAELLARRFDRNLGEEPCATSTSSTAMPTASARFTN